MASKLFVGGLSYSTTSEGLRECLAQCGAVVSARVITDQYSGRSRGFGFVEMSTEDEAKAAIARLDGQTLDGRRIKVQAASPQGTAAGGSRQGGFRSGGAFGASQRRSARW